LVWRRAQYTLHTGRRRNVHRRDTLCSTSAPMPDVQRRHWRIKRRFDHERAMSSRQAEKQRTEITVPSSSRPINFEPRNLPPGSPPPAPIDRPSAWTGVASLAVKQCVLHRRPTRLPWPPCPLVRAAALITSAAGLAYINSPPLQERRGCKPASSEDRVGICRAGYAAAARKRRRPRKGTQECRRFF
jgi:hypothetical protein